MPPSDQAFGQLVARVATLENWKSTTVVHLNNLHRFIELLIDPHPEGVIDSEDPCIIVEAIRVLEERRAQNGTH